MPTRPAVESWNRGQLEDRFYNIFGENQTLKRENASLEKKLRLTSTRIREKLSGTSTENVIELEEKNRELERQNRLLSQKLKALRHQLITYTRPQSQQTTLNFLTSRGTSRPRSTAAVQTVDTDESSKPDVIQRSASLAEISTTTTTSVSAKKSLESRARTPQIVDSTGSGSTDKATIIRLHRIIQENGEHNDDLLFEATKAKEKVENLTSTITKLQSEIDILKRKTMTDDEKDTQLAVIEKELEIVKTENSVLKTANEKFVTSALADEEKHKTMSQQLHSLQKHLDDLEKKRAEQAAERETLYRKNDALEAQNKSLLAKNKRQKEKLADRRHRSSSEKTNANTPAQIMTTAKESESPKKQKREKSIASSVIDRLFDDVTSIVDSHYARADGGSWDGLESREEPQTIAKWRQLYETVYSELEKTRNLLMIQHRMNERHKKEISLLNDTNAHIKRQYESKLAEFVMELNRRAKRIEVLENQLRSLANDPSFPLTSSSDTKWVTPSLDLGTPQSSTEIVLKLTSIKFTDLGRTIAHSPDPVIFLSLEFFDFELQTTPQISSSQGELDYVTVYDVIVSNLFVHYVETDAIAIEAFEICGVGYEFFGRGTISLKKLLQTDQTASRITGTLKLQPKHKNDVLAMISYVIDVPVNLIKSLKAQKRSITASTFLPIDVDGSRLPSDLYNELTVQIHRASNLSILASGKSSKALSVYAVYQVFDLAPHLTAVQYRNSDPIFNDSKSYTLPLGASLHRFLKTEELVINIVDESTNSAIGKVSLPLFVLARNQSLKGSFNLVDGKGETTEATIDLSIFWKFAYVNDDDKLDLQPVEKVKYPKEKPPVPPPRPLIPPVESKPVVHQPEDKQITNQNVNWKSIFSQSDEAHHANLQSIQEDFSTSSSSSERNNVENAGINSSVSDEGSVNTVVEKVPTPEAPPPQPTQVFPAVPEKSVVMFQESSSSDESSHTYVVNDSDFKKENSEIQKNVLKCGTGDTGPSKKTKNEIEVKKDEEEIASASEVSSIEDSDDDDITGLSEELDRVNEEAKKMEENALAGLPIKLPPVPPPRTVRSRIVEFKEPLHSSIPPSETSSASQTPRPRDDEKEITETRTKSVPSLEATPLESAIRQRVPAEEKINNTKEPSDTSIWRVTIRVGRLSVTENSLLLEVEYDDTDVFIEWTFLDFPAEACETAESLPLPRNSWSSATFECEKTYDLTPRRLALLKQWIENSSRLNFNLVTDPENDDNCDDLGVGQLDLRDVISSSVHSITFYEVNGEPIATLDFTVIYSDDLVRELTSDDNEQE